MKIPPAGHAPLSATNLRSRFLGIAKCAYALVDVDSHCFFLTFSLRNYLIGFLIGLPRSAEFLPSVVFSIMFIGCNQHFCVEFLIKKLGGNYHEKIVKL